MLLLMLLGITAAATNGSAQSVELVFTPGSVQQALAIKSALKVEKLDSFGALALVGASPERRKAYADRVAGITAVVILGEDALKAASQVEFSVPIICVNAAGATVAKNKIIRVFDRATAPANAKAVGPGEVAGLIAAGREVSLKGDVGSVVQAAVMALK